VALQLGFRDSSLDQLVKGLEIERYFKLAFRMRRCLVVLEDSNLSLELVIELPQRLLLTDGVLAVEIRLLPIAIRLGLLFLHLLFHISEHLKELVFVLLWWLDTGCPLRRGGADVFCYMRLIDGWWATVPPAVLMPLPFDVAPLGICFLGAIGVVREAF